MLTNNNSSSSNNKNIERLQKLARSKLPSRRARAGDVIRKMLSDIYEEETRIRTTTAIDIVAKKTGLSKRKVKKLVSDSVWYHTIEQQQPSNRWIQSVIDMKKDGIIK